jgi:hypothetical protein
MRLVHGCALAVAFVIAAPTAIGAQAQAQADANRVVAGGGISVPGRTGKTRKRSRRDRLSTTPSSRHPGRTLKSPLDPR